MSRMCFRLSGPAAVLALAAVLPAAAAAPTAAISASPESGRAPLGVFFDAGASSADAETFLWEFGDGAASTAKSVTHIYTVAGTYTATLTVANAAGETAASQITISVSGNSEGPVTGDMNFRWVITSGKFTLKHSRANQDTLVLNAVFNTVDLPARIEGLAASFSINGRFTISGVLGPEGAFVNPTHYPKPTYSLQIIPAEQTLAVYISKAELKEALALSGATNSTVVRPGAQAPVTFGLTVGAQTYSITENFTYTSAAGASGRGDFILKKGVGSIVEGFFAVARASALENLEGTSHYFEFDGYLSRPLAVLIAAPGTGTFTFRFHDADKVVVPFDRLQQKRTKISYVQSDRALGGIRRLTIDTQNRRVFIATWDLLSDSMQGGTGLPLRGRMFLAFNFALRLDLDQPGGTTLQAVTATQLTRRTKDDAFWQTGRRRQ